MFDGRLIAAGLDRYPQAEQLERLCYTVTRMLFADFSFLSSLTDVAIYPVAGWPELGENGSVENSACRLVIAEARTVSIPDTTLDPRVSHLPWTATFRAYLGTKVSGNRVFCVLAAEPREWSERDIAGIEALARLIDLVLNP